MTSNERRLSVGKNIFSLEIVFEYAYGIQRMCLLQCLFLSILAKEIIILFEKTTVEKLTVSGKFVVWKWKNLLLTLKIVVIFVI